MRKLLKYLLPIFVFAVVSHSKESSLTEVSLEDFKTVEESVIAQQTTLTDADNGEEFCLPRQSSSANTFRAHNSSKRTSSPHRTNTVFIASGKVINSALRFFIQQKSIIAQSSLADPAFRLLKLCKLII
jgi:hypothetical protein